MLIDVQLKRSNRSSPVDMIQNISRAKKAVATALNRSRWTETSGMETAEAPWPGKTGCGDARSVGQPLHCLRVQWCIGDLNADTITFQEPFTKNGQVPPFVFNMLPPFAVNTPTMGTRAGSDTNRIQS